MRKSGRWIAACAVLAMLAGTMAARAAVKKVDADPKGVKVVSELLSALSQQDPQQRIDATVLVLHKSMLTPDGKDLLDNVKRYSYKKAYENVHLYQQPAAIYEVHEVGEQTIGFQNTAERGMVYKYFVKKKDGQPGRPAPIHVFFPNGGGEPKCNNIGSL